MHAHKMPREAHPDRTNALIAIREHVGRLGTVEGQRAARKLFPNIGKPTWESWCRLVRLGERTDVEQPAEAVAVVTRPLTPVTPIAADVELRGFEFDHRIAEMDAAARALIDYAWPIDPETGRRGRLKNPLLLKAGHAALAQMASLVVKHREAVFNQARLEELYEVIIDEVGKADRGVQRAVLARLRELSERRGNPGARFGHGVAPATETADF